MSKVVLKIENVSKQYRLGVTGTGTLSHDINRWWHRMKGKEDPYSQIGVVNDRTIVGGEYVWALKNINIEVKEGEVLGIIGKNGAGKSTLLKLLSQVTSPTTGNIKTKGRMASLLEVGTGFHPEFTGRENIYLNGAILGMSQAEISNKLYQIISFSGCAKYVDTPVKRYSSGMRVRLGFAVAAFLEPDIMVVDEVLAVGDAEFQKQAIGKMQDASSESGRTVLFVSHNMSAIKSLCSRVIVLKDGKIDFNGDTDEGIAHYLNLNVVNHKLLSQSFEDNNSLCYVKDIKINAPLGYFEFVEDRYSFEVTVVLKELIADLFLGLIVENANGVPVFISSSDEVEENIFRKIKKTGDYHISLSFSGKILKPGNYYITFSLRGISGTPYHKIERAVSFEVADNTTYRGIKGRYRTTAIIAPEMKYEIKELSNDIRNR